MVRLDKAKPLGFSQLEIRRILPFLGGGIVTVEDVHSRLVAGDGEQLDGLFLHKQLVHPEFEGPPCGGGRNRAGL